MSAYSKTEALNDYDAQFRAAARYWAKLPDLTPEERCDGVRFSIMSIIDGCSSLPGLNLVLAPHPDDKDDAIACGSQWYEPGMVINDDATLHDRKTAQPDHHGGDK